MANQMIGRGNEEGRQLFRSWFKQLDDAAAAQSTTAYVFVMGSMAELLRCFDMNITFPEINSLQMAVRHAADEYITAAEDYGFSPDVCGYVKADVAMQLRGGQHPMGRVPRPSLAVLTNACNTYIKWAEIWERMYGTPMFTLDVPLSRHPADRGLITRDDMDRDVKYVERQIQELITLCERVSGTRFDIDRLRETMRLTNEMSGNYARLLELNRNSPAPYDALIEGTVYLGVANGFRGTEAGARYFANLVEEIELKTKLGIGTETDEKYRLIFVGVPCYPIFRRFFELFAEWGGVYVGSSYLWFAAGGMNLGYQYDLADPLRSLAEGTLRGVRAATDAMMFQDQLLVDAINDYHADGVVFHPVKSCRTVSTGLADTRRAVMEKSDAMCLYIESDMMDKRTVSEAQLKNRIDAFFEGLAARKLRVAAGA